MRTYYIIDRTGREVLSAPCIRNVTAQGYALIRREDWSYAVFHAADESIYALPTSLDGQPLVYELEEDYLIVLRRNEWALPGTGIQQRWMQQAGHHYLKASVLYQPMPRTSMAPRVLPPSPIFSGLSTKELPALRTQKNEGFS